MADGTTPLETQQQGSLEEAIAERDRLLAQSNERLARMEETLQALRPPPPGPAPTQDSRGRPIIPQHLRQQIAAQGISDAELEANAPLIVPFLQAYLGQAAGEVLAMLQQQNDEITMLKMLRDVNTYPYAEDVIQDMVSVRDAESKQGRYIDPATAYKIAVANNYEKLQREPGQGSSEGQFSSRSAPATPQASPATVRSRDMSAGSSLRSMRAPVTAPEKAPTTADDLNSMSREERRAFFEQHANTPIKAAG